MAVLSNDLLQNSIVKMARFELLPLSTNLWIFWRTARYQNCVFLLRNDNHEDYQSLLQRNQMNQQQQQQQQQSFSLSQPTFSISAMTNNTYRDHSAAGLMASHQQNQGICIYSLAVVGTRYR